MEGKFHSEDFREKFRRSLCCYRPDIKRKREEFMVSLRKKNRKAIFNIKRGLQADNDGEENDKEVCETTLNAYKALGIDRADDPIDIIKFAKTILHNSPADRQNVLEVILDLMCNTNIEEGEDRRVNMKRISAEIKGCINKKKPELCLIALKVLRISLHSGAFCEKSFNTFVTSGLLNDILDILEICDDIRTKMQLINAAIDCIIAAAISCLFVLKSIQNRGIFLKLFDLSERFTDQEIQRYFPNFYTCICAVTDKLVAVNCHYDIKKISRILIFQLDTIIKPEEKVPLQFDEEDCKQRVSQEMMAHQILRSIFNITKADVKLCELYLEVEEFKIILLKCLSSCKDSIVIPSLQIASNMSMPNFEFDIISYLIDHGLLEKLKDYISHPNEILRKDFQLLFYNILVQCPTVYQEICEKGELRKIILDLMQSESISDRYEGAQLFNMILIKGMWNLEDVEIMGKDYLTILTKEHEESRVQITKIMEDDFFAKFIESLEEPIIPPQYIEESITILENIMEYYKNSEMYQQIIDYFRELGGEEIMGKYLLSPNKNLASCYSNTSLKIQHFLERYMDYEPFDPIETKSDEMDITEICETICSL
ncbi:unnamed protein product [Moneuplotes crassus]|uniref:Uncharacterized protein n=1 Tax=Euplotes crassus TaxID=5936 RepID=A0AAD1U9H9_EUPCR|nr:unnamed protein product [Moneuplotes crassus]